MSFFSPNEVRKRHPFENLGPQCSMCRGYVLRHLRKTKDSPLVEPDSGLPFSGELPAGMLLYAGTECEGCGHIFCLKCHDFGNKGPKCPNCGEYQLMPLLRAVN